MTSSKSIPTNQNETLDYIDESEDQLDEQRLLGLQEEQDNQLIKDEILQREKRRLAAKHGNTHPRVLQAENRIAYNKEMFTGLKNEVEKASIKTTTLPGNSWLVQGRVFDQDNRAVKGVTVFLSNKNRKWQEVLGSACTTDQGYYSLTANEKVLEKIEKGEALYLSVSDKNKSILYFADAPVSFVAGVVWHEDIYLKNDQCITPPSGSKSEEKPATESWVVKGKITDENNKALNGLTVSLYDKDLFFDDVLGTTLTNKSGSFEIIYRAEAFALLFERKPDLYLKVLDSNGKILHNSEKTIRPGAGQVEEMNIKIKSTGK